MKLFDTSKYRGVKNIRGKGGKPDVFARKGGKLYGKHVSKLIGKSSLPTRKKRFITRNIVIHSRPGSPGIDRGEFLTAMKEMADNPNDPITRKDVEIVEKHFRSL